MLDFLTCARYREDLLTAPHRDPKETGDRTLGSMLGVLSREGLFSLTLTFPKETGKACSLRSHWG